MILIFTEKKTSRLEYIFSLIFRDVLGAEVALTTDADECRHSSLPVVCYSSQPIATGLFMGAHPLLTTPERRMPPLEPLQFRGETGFLATPPGSFMPFDPFASAFLAVSRLEEYEQGSRDPHGRFLAANSFLSRYGLLHKAMVNRWAGLVATLLEEAYDRKIFPPPSCRVLTTVDIDNAWAFRHKGLFRNSGSLLKKIFTGHWKEAAGQMMVLSGLQDDPYDTYDYLAYHFRANEDKLLFFFLLGDYGPYDKQVSFRNKRLQQLVRQTAGRFQTGLHPSYKAGQEEAAGPTLKEKKRMEKITGSPVTHSRQHYLLLQFPHTYRKLLEAGITSDYSMGYPEVTGFRAGTATPFFFYDLEKEEITPLRIHPFLAMDVTLRQYQRLSAGEAIDLLTSLLQEVHSTGGVYTTIWHNESLHNQGVWKGYKMVFERITQEGISHDRR